MVSLGSRRRGRAIVLAMLVAMLAVLGPAASAAADPDPSGGGTYGFNSACEQLQQGLGGFGIPGVPSLGDVTGTGCKLLNAGTHPGDAVTAIADKAWDTSFGKVVNSLLTGLGEALVISLTWWTKIPTSNVVSQSDLFGEIRAYTFQLQILCLAGSMIMCAIRLAMAHRSGAAAEATETFRVLARSVFASAIFSTVLVLGTQAGDAFSDWVINAATNNDAKGTLEAIVQTQVFTALSPGLVFVIVLIGMIGALAQAVFAVVREALLVVVVGILPLAAASSGTHTGKGFYEKLTAWSLAFVLYKPIAALVYMVAFKMAGTGGTKAAADGVPTSDDAQRALVGVVLLCSAALVLPAVMRLVSPLTSMGGGISGALIGAGAVTSAANWAVGGAGATGAAPSSSGNIGGPSRGGGGCGGGGVPPTGAGKGGGGGGGRSGGGGSSGAKGAARAAGAAKAGGPAAAGVAAAGGPAGAIAAGAVKAVGSAHRAIDSMVGAAAGPVARPSGAGSAAVPR
ncbi:hypothetical protein [Nocardia sp. NPDC006630]|uniref:hypothetical protein n=1 Tax=Nocardia sp. NPDC006630 TaxID=3157181 RepID=UPI0033AD574A